MNSETTRQLAVIDYNLYSNCTHMLVRSTAPENAEEGGLHLPIRTRHGLLMDQTDQALASLRASLQDFFERIKEKGEKSQEDFLNALQNKLKIVLNIHGYSTPLASFHGNMFSQVKDKLDRDFKARASTLPPYPDYVVFIDYSWPSEQAFSLSLCSVLRATPFLLRLLLILVLVISLVGGALIWSSVITGLWALGIGVADGLLLGISCALLLLRMVTYFRDRERAASAAVYDGVELVRWLHEILLQEITTAVPQIHEVGQLRELIRGNPTKVEVELSLLAHSMGCFVATQLVRTLSDVFDPLAIQRWIKLGREGPFSKIDPAQVASDQPVNGSIGEIFRLGQLVLVAPDIPVWSLTNGRSNPLQSCLRRFQDVSLFTNDADVVLRLLSTLANFFVFPSSTREGGYRLGNVVPLDSGRLSWGRQALTYGDIGLYGMRGRRLNSPISLTDPPFCASKGLARQLNLIDCTDYDDLPLSTAGKSGPRLASPGPAWRPLRYLRTLVACLRRRLDPHGGYFQGAFCLDLMFQLLLSGSTSIHHAYPTLAADLKRHQIHWITVK